MGTLVPEKRGTHLLASLLRHLGGPTKERFQRAPGGARIERCPVIEISTFRCEQQPRLRELCFVKSYLVVLFFPNTESLANWAAAVSNLFACVRQAGRSTRPGRHSPRARQPTPAKERRFPKSPTRSSHPSSSSRFSDEAPRSRPPKTRLAGPARPVPQGAIRPACLVAFDPRWSYAVGGFPVDAGLASRASCARRSGRGAAVGEQLCE